MAQKNLFRDILRLITPEEVAVLTDTVLGRQKVMLKLIVQEDLGLISKVAIEEIKVEAKPVAEVPNEPKELKVEEARESDEGQAKILPFVTEQSAPIIELSPEEKLEMPSETQEPVNQSVENYVEINEDGSVKFKEEEEVFEEKIDLTEFILSQQEKCKEVSHEMKKKEVMALYNKNATVDLSRERALRSDPSRKYNDGVLINKRQG